MDLNESSSVKKPQFTFVVYSFIIVKIYKKNKITNDKSAKKFLLTPITRKNGVFGVIGKWTWQVD